MKKFLFYFGVGLQIIVLLFLVFRFEKIDATGQEIKIQTLTSDFPVYDEFIDGDLYVKYDINRITNDKWVHTTSLDYNTRVYVLLQKDKMDIYRVRKASTEKLTAINEEEAVIVGLYNTSMMSMIFIMWIMALRKFNALINLEHLSRRINSLFPF